MSEIVLWQVKILCRFNERKNFLDNIFRNEKIVAEHLKKIITETYAAAQEKKVPLYEVARRRFRKKENYILTCIMIGISPATYYRLLSTFFKIAERKMEKFLEDLRIE